MKHLIVLAATLLASHVASADAPTWCGGQTLDLGPVEREALKTSTDITTIVPAIAAGLCSPSLDAHHPELEAARKAWGAKLGMSDADWADAVAWAKAADKQLKAALSTKELAQLTPIDQYVAISQSFGDGVSGRADLLYATDMLEQQLSALGRMAFIDWCLKQGAEPAGPGPTYATKWAVCWPDIEKYDGAKVSSEIAADTAHDGVAKMWLRFHAYGLPAAIKDLSDRKAALIKTDATYQKVFEVAAKARDEWAQTIGSNTKLLELALAMDAGAIFHSRQLLDGCEPKTEEALAAAVSTIPAKAFAGMHDDRQGLKKGFAEAAGPLLVTTPVVNVAAVAYSECHIKSATADYLETYLQRVPGSRGPRNFALAAVMGETFKFDDLRAPRLQYPKFERRPYLRTGGAQTSAGGVVKSVKTVKDTVVVSMEQTSMKQEDCVSEHHSNHVARINNGVVEYQLICDKWAIVTHDTSYQDFKIRAGHEKLLKPGVVFSAVYMGGDGVSFEPVAIWANKTAKTPSFVLGGAVK